MFTNTRTFDITNKAWGTTQTLISDRLAELHKIVVKPGGYCSRHHHERRHNHFSVASGQLVVMNYSTNINRILTEGMSYTAQAGDVHKFINYGPADVVAYELYTVTEAHMEMHSEARIDPDDIIRQDVGGVLQANCV